MILCSSLASFGNTIVRVGGRDESEDSIAGGKGVYLI